MDKAPRGHCNDNMQVHISRCFLAVCCFPCMYCTIAKEEPWTKSLHGQWSFLATFAAQWLVCHVSYSHIRAIQWVFILRVVDVRYTKFMCIKMEKYRGGNGKLNTLSYFPLADTVYVGECNMQNCVNGICTSDGCECHDGWNGTQCTDCEWYTNTRISWTYCDFNL